MVEAVGDNFEIGERLWWNVELVLANDPGLEHSRQCAKAQLLDTVSEDLNFLSVSKRRTGRNKNNYQYSKQEFSEVYCPMYTRLQAILVNTTVQFFYCL